MNKRTDLSIIIPAHNCADTLRRAVNSVNLGYQKKVEIIIVENGSTDSTLAVAQDICQKQNEVTVVSSAKGVSNARNKGLEMATGRRIMFLDADDSFTNGAFNFILSHLSSDLAIYSYRSGEKEKQLFPTTQRYTGKELTALIGEMLTYPTDYLTVWGKVFDKRVIARHQLRFDNNLRLSEDSLFVIQYLFYCKSIHCYRDCIYNYSRNEGSTVRKYNKSTVKDYLISLRAVHDFIFERFFSVKHYYFKYGLMQLNLIGVHGIFDTHNQVSFFKKMKLLKLTVQDPLLIECLKGISIKDLNSIKFIAIIFIKLHMFLIAGQIFALRSYFS